MNKKLAKKLKVSKEKQLRIIETHNLLYDITSEPEKYNNPVQLIEDYEYKLQELWGFDLDKTKHTWRTRIKGCSCPKMDNFDLHSHNLLWSNGNCKWHDIKSVDTIWSNSVGFVKVSK